MILQMLTILYVLVCFALIGLVLLQRGKGADIGAAMGSGASQTVFGSQGSANFLSRSTAWLAALFYLLCLGMAALTYRQAQADPFAAVDIVEVSPSNEITPAVLPE